MQVDWSFSNAPDGTRATETAPPPAPAPDKVPRRPLPWRLILALAGAAGVAALGAWLFTRLGWLRLQSQLAAQVAYEDQRALAGDVNALLAVQAAGQPAWRDQIAADARLGLAAPLPAGDLRPAGTPPRLARLDPLGGDLFTATVTRDYLDPAGKMVAFDLAQTYRNLAPGAWERLALDASALNTTARFQGQRLWITLPAADLPWLGPALLQADDLIVQACADWRDACPTSRRLVAAFGVANELANPVAAAVTRAAGGGQWTDKDAASPRIFFLSPAPRPNSVSVPTLAAPLLAGRPHDAASENAFARSVSVQLLGLFAGELTGSPRANNDYFLDALVARVEARHLGAAATPTPIAPQDFIPLNRLWQGAGAGQVETGWRTDLAGRREAFDFLNFAIAGVRLMPSNDNGLPDGRLLLNLRLGLAGGASLDDWLTRGLGSNAAGLPERWTAQTLAAFAARPVTDWNPLDRLLMACDDGVFQVRGGARRRIVPDTGPADNTSAVLSAASPDGRYAARAIYQTTTDSAGAPSTVTELQIIDLAHGSGVVGNANSPWYDTVTVFGWSATNELIFAVHDPANGQTNASGPVVLHSYNPANQASQVLIPDPVSPLAVGAPFWSADHSALLVGLMDNYPKFQHATAWALLSFRPGAQPRRLPMVGDTPALSPDGTRVANVHFGNPAGPSGSTSTVEAGIDRMEVLDVASGAVTSLAASNDLALPQGSAHFWGPRWTADGQMVAWTVHFDALGNDLLIAPAAGGPARVWTTGGVEVDLGSFSPDGRYLLGGSRQDLAVPGQIWLIDQQAPGMPPPLTVTADSSVWAPSGHRLVIAGPAGVSSLDPGSGQWEWLGAWQNCKLRE